MMLSRRHVAAGLLAAPWGSRLARAQSSLAFSPAFTFSQVIELSGPDSRAGDAWRNGVELAVQDINAAGGVLGQGLAVTTFDANNGRPAVQRALERDSLALLGPLGAAAARTAAPMARAARVAMITGSDAPDLTGPGASVFRTAPGPAVRAPRLAGFLASQMAVRRLGLVWGTGEPGRIGRDLWANALKAAGVEIALEQSLPPAPPGFVAEVGALARAGVDAVLLLLSPAEGVRFVREARRQGLRAPLVGDLTLATPRALAQGGADTEGLRCQIDFLPSPPPELAAMAGFATRYEAAFKQPPDSPAARGYTAVGLLAAALKGLGRADRTGLADALRGLRLTAGSPGILQDCAIEPSGEMSRATFVAELHRGILTPLATLG